MPIKVWEYLTDKNGDIVYDEKNNYKRDFSKIGVMKLFKWEREMFMLGKSRSEKDCCSCDKEIRKGCYFYGDRRGGWRVCINCYSMFVNNFINSLKEHIKTAKKSLKEFKAKEGFLIKSNLVGSL